MSKKGSKNGDKQPKIQKKGSKNGDIFGKKIFMQKKVPKTVTIYEKTYKIRYYEAIIKSNYD